MKVVVVSLMLLAGYVAYAQTSNEPFALVLKADKSEVAAGDPVFVWAVMTNTSDHNVDCTRTSSNGLDRNYQYIVLDENGHPVPQIPKKYPEIGETGSIWPCDLNPGETSQPSGGRLSILYDLSHPGKYSIQVAKHAKFDASSPLIKSNVITITVLPTSQMPAEKK